MAALDNVKNRIMGKLAVRDRRREADEIVDSITKPRFSGVVDAYRQTWRETFNPAKSFSWNAIARTRNFYKVSYFVLVRRVES